MEAGGLSAAAAADPPAAIDWSAAWWAAAPPDARGLDLGDPGGALDALNAAARVRGLRNAAGLPLRFVDASAVASPAYEAHIGATGEVPTRLAGEGFVHDALNALAWLRFPRIKLALNALQARQIARDGIGPRRGALRDAATLFDENAVLLAVAEDDPAARGALAALRARDWRAALVARRDAWGRTIDAVAFGHALLQKLLRPRTAITAHAWAVPLPREWFEGSIEARCDALDARLGDASRLEDMLADRAARMPLPVLGVPGWWPANAEPRFYDDASVFRPRRDGSPGIEAPGAEAPADRAPPEQAPPGRAPRG